MAKKPKKPMAGAPLWMVTFSDMMTLLLTFFVLLLSMATLDQVKFTQAAGSLSDAFGVGILASSTRSEIAPPQVVSNVPIDDDFNARVYQRLRTQLRELKLDRQIELVKDRGAVVLRVDEAVLFGVGQSTLNPDAHPVLRKVAGLVRPLPLNVKIEGHTDDIGDDMQNWELSVARAVSVLRFMVSDQLLPLTRISATGYGSHRPLFPNLSERERALNRRVEFVLESQGDPQQELPYLIDARDQAPF
jgi:chemotaxis protein MotB